MEGLIRKHLLNNKTLGKQAPTQPGEDWLLIASFWLRKGPLEIKENEGYIITPTVESRLKQIARAIVTRKYPVLLQGPTSAGKTSLIEHLAKITGNTFVRINNHEHTDIQEYMGSYLADTQGRLAFHEGALVEAVRKGYWIVLDELNLAPSEVLEALNRLLDDNQELFIPETQETVVPHPNFLLFATQNPPGIYGGRKVLSRAFRNRFVELHVDDIPDDELTTILELRCKIPPSYCKCMIATLKELQLRRSTSSVFAGKKSFITPRDLFRWADRQPQGYQGLAEEGYMILAERLRTQPEKDVVQEVKISSHLTFAHFHAPHLT
jgi:midasin